MPDAAVTNPLNLVSRPACLTLGAPTALLSGLLYASALDDGQVDYAEVALFGMVFPGSEQGH